MNGISRTLVPCMIIALFGTTVSGQTLDSRNLPAFPGPTPAPALIETPVSAHPFAGVPKSAVMFGHGEKYGSGDKNHSWQVPLRLTLRKDWGDGVGYENGYSYAEAFIPLWQPKADCLLFTDLRVVNFDDDDRWEFNAGVGGRAYSLTLDGFLGWNAFYDSRSDEGRAFGQLGVGVEYLRPWFEFRANGYFITGDDRRAGFIGNSPIFTVAMDGVDAEIGAPVPFLEQFSTRAYVGYYHYEADGVPSTDGIRGRLEAQLGNSSALHFVAQNDPLFDTTITGGVSISFGAPAYSSRPGPASLREVLGQRVVRDVNVVLTTIFAPKQTSGQLPPP